MKRKWVLALALFSLAISLLLIYGPRLIDKWRWQRNLELVKHARGDMRTMAIAAETFMMDHNGYPDATADKKLGTNRGVYDPKGLLDKLPTPMIIAVDPPNENERWTFRPRCMEKSKLLGYDSHPVSLTTPLAYLDHYFTDPFAPVPGATYAYCPTESFRGGKGIGYIFWSSGPDGVYDLTIDNIAQAYNPTDWVPSDFLIERTYDPSNGAKSGGDVYWYKH